MLSVVELDRTIREPSSAAAEIFSAELAIFHAAEPAPTITELAIAAEESSRFVTRSLDAVPVGRTTPGSSSAAAGNCHSRVQGTPVVVPSPTSVGLTYAVEAF